jgi:hypothetical protein
MFLRRARETPEKHCSFLSSSGTVSKGGKLAGVCTARRNAASANYFFWEAAHCPTRRDLASRSFSWVFEMVFDGVYSLDWAPASQKPGLVCAERRLASPVGFIRPVGVGGLRSGPACGCALAAARWLNCGRCTSEVPPSLDLLRCRCLWSHRRSHRRFPSIDFVALPPSHPKRNISRAGLHSNPKKKGRREELGPCSRVLHACAVGRLVTGPEAGLGSLQRFLSQQGVFRTSCM